MVDVSQKVIEDAKALLVRLSEKWTYGVTMGRTLKLDGKVAGGVDYTACHAWVNHAFEGYIGDRWVDGKKGMDKTFLVLSCHSKTRSKGICSEAAHEAIVLWMAPNECPLSKYILNRDDKDSLINGGIIILCGEGGAGKNEALWLCKVLRYAVEGGQAVDVWYELYKAGVNGVLAIFIASHVRTLKGATFGYTGPEYHSTVFGADYTAAWLLRGQTDRNAESTGSVFVDPAVKDAKLITGTQISKFCQPITKSDGWGGTVQGVGAEREDFIRKVLELQKELEAEIAGVPAEEPKKPTKSTVYLDLDL